MTNKAPAGGLVSSVNGAFYAGGEFMPVHGLAAPRAAAAQRHGETGRPVYGQGRRCFDVHRHDALAFHVWADDLAQARATATEHGAESWASVGRRW